MLCFPNLFILLYSARPSQNDRVNAPGLLTFGRRISDRENIYPGLKRAEK